MSSKEQLSSAKSYLPCLMITLKNRTSCERIKKGGGGPVKLYKLGISKLGPLIKNPTLAA